jgi:membrane-associated protein
LLVDLVRLALDIVLHMDKYLNHWLELYGLWIYGILFVIIFCETGLVVTPFLPGDSLLFTAGAMASMPGSPLSPLALIAFLWCAGVLGDASNFMIGLKVGPKVFHSDTSRFLNKRHLLRTQKFYEKHGGKAIFLGHFMPIIRTFTPFVAGIGKMKYRRFGLFNVTGVATWVSSFVLAGYFFGNLPSVKRNFHFVVLAIIVISVMPAVIEFIKARREAKAEAKAAAEAAGS